MGTQVTLTIPDDVYRRAQRIAQSGRRNVADVLVESIVLAENEPRPEAERQAAVDGEEAAFRRLHPALWQKYPGQYVAIYGGELVDHDEDQVALYLRVKERYPDEFVWIAPVRPQPEEEYAIHSPRFVEHL